MSLVMNSRAVLSALTVAAACAYAGQAMAQAAAPAAPADSKPASKVKPATKPAPAAHPAEHPAAKKPAAPRHPVAKKGAKAAPVVVEAPLPEAAPDQLKAAEMIYYGHSDCEFKQTMDVAINPKFPGYVDVKFDKKEWTMKPVLSSTGALRLEDVKNQAIVIQIAQKSMLLNTVTGQRLVDECISPKQRELAAEAAAAAKTQAARAADAPGAAASDAVVK